MISAASDLDRYTTSSTFSNPLDALSKTPDPVALAAREGLLATPRTLTPWLFYDQAGSLLFERITELPEYYLTRTERALFEAHAHQILDAAANGRSLSIVELGAGTATKTGILLRAAIKRQRSVLYQPIDVSDSALAEAELNLAPGLPGLSIHAQVANYVTDAITLERPPAHRILALYIGSSIGNFAPAEAISILRNLRAQLQPGDSLLLGTDLAPGPNKSVATLLAAYDDAAGVTAAFNRNILTRLNRDLGANFNPDCFRHVARWNAAESRIEMHLDPVAPQHVTILANSAGPALALTFLPGETIHTENSVKFTQFSLDSLFLQAGFRTTRTWQDSAGLFAVTLASAL